MKKLLLATTLMMLATPALAKEYTIKEISDPAGSKPYYFEPSTLSIQPGDTVTFINAQEDTHNVMFDSVPKQVDEMIMGADQKKESEKWSYTFTVPGSYHFHCHPHKSLGMEGTLIVGQASASGDTKSVDHHHAEEGQASGAAPEAKGKINSIDAASHSVNITHEPIAALKWPAMTMDFPVAKEVDLSGFKAGAGVAFKLKLENDKQYWIIDLKPAQK
ncbi:MAG: copper-binding protein [Alphaproteobacteria bacterium]|nr:copper-binding protein [Alphaproteobacteria bacterium]